MSDTIVHRRDVQRSQRSDLTFYFFYISRLKVFPDLLRLTNLSRDGEFSLRPSFSCPLQGIQTYHSSCPKILPTLRTCILVSYHLLTVLNWRGSSMVSVLDEPNSPKDSLLHTVHPHSVRTSKYSPLPVFFLCSDPKESLVPI